MLAVIRVLLISALAVAALLGLLTCSQSPRRSAAVPAPLGSRTGDEIVACGHLIHTGTRVVLWTDPGGYNAYSSQRLVPEPPPATPAPPSPSPGSSAPSEALPARFNARAWPGRTGEPDLAGLRAHVDQFVIHYDAAGTARSCFHTLHDVRGLSVHFLLDLDGTIYQTLDLKERAWHATIANDRSIGIEVANIGAYEVNPKKPTADPLSRWYRADGPGGTRLTLPLELGDGGIQTPSFVARPARPEPVVGVVNGKLVRMYDFTPQQYESLIRLTAALCREFPNLRCDAPRTPAGDLEPGVLPPERFSSYAGLLGHYHVQTEKLDPGPAFQWDRVLTGARRVLRTPMLANGENAQ